MALAYLERYLPEDWPDRTTEQLRDWFETENLIAGGIFATGGGILGALIGGPFGAAVGATGGGIYGGFVQESAEEAQAAGVPKLLSYNQFFQIYGAARMLKGRRKRVIYRQSPRVRHGATQKEENTTRPKAI